LVGRLASVSLTNLSTDNRSLHNQLDEGSGTRLTDNNNSRAFEGGGASSAARWRADEDEDQIGRERRHMIPDDAGFGYDPTVEEPFDLIRPHFVDTLPAAAVNPAFLPPVGRQGTLANAGYPGSCAAWSSAYGLATFTGARAGLVQPSLPTGQASPAFIYVQVLREMGAAAATCGGSMFASYFSILKNGTASMADAPYVPDCNTLWQAYAGATIAANTGFAVASVKGVATSDLDSVKQAPAAHSSTARGCSLTGTATAATRCLTGETARF
jgi:hypothetical protein